MLPCIIFLLVVSGFNIALTSADECAAAKKKCDDDGSTAVKAATKISDKCDAAKAWRQCINNLEDSCKDLTFSDDLTQAESDNYCPTPEEKCAAAMKKCDDDGSEAVKKATTTSDKCNAAWAWRQCINNQKDSCQTLTFSDDLTRAESDNYCPTPEEKCAAAMKKCNDDGSEAVKKATTTSDKCNAAWAWRQCINNQKDSCQTLTFPHALTWAESDNCPTSEIEVRCPPAEKATVSAFKNGVCYYYFTGPGNLLTWKNAGHFCRNNSLGDQPLVFTANDIDFLVSIAKKAGPSAGGGWLGGAAINDHACNGFKVTDSIRHWYDCKSAHSFLCAVIPEQPKTDLGLRCQGAKNPRTTVFHNGICYTYFMDEGDRLIWEEAGEFCGNNSLGALPLAINPEDKAPLTTVVKSINPYAGGAWIGGQKKGNLCNALLFLSDALQHKYHCDVKHSFICADAGKNPCPESKYGVEWIYAKGKCFYVWTRKTFNWLEAQDFCKTNVGARTIDPLIYQEVYSAQYLVHKLGYGNDFWMGGQVQKNKKCSKLPDVYTERRVSCSEKNTVVCVAPSETEINLRCPEALDGDEAFFEYGVCYLYHSNKLSWSKAKDICETSYKGSMPSVRLDKDLDLLKYFLKSKGQERGWLGTKIETCYDDKIGSSELSCKSKHTEDKNFVCAVQPKFLKTEILANPCPAGWIYNDGNCYFVSREKTTWSKAKDLCEAKQTATLADFFDNHEKFFLRSYVKGIDSFKDWNFWMKGSGSNKCFTLIKSTGSGETEASGESAGSGEIEASDESAGSGEIEASDESAGSGETKASDRSAGSSRSGRMDCDTPNSFICVTRSEKVLKARCPEPKDGSKWWMKNGMCYIYFPKKLTWPEAGKFCAENFAGHLPFTDGVKDYVFQLKGILKSEGGDRAWLATELLDLNDKSGQPDHENEDAESDKSKQIVAKSKSQKKDGGEQTQTLDKTQKVPFFCAVWPKLVEVKTS